MTVANEKYTKPQRYAIFEDCGNLLVSAAAGSGKTFTLSAHITELIKNGRADIDEMLVVTFTRSAAADMKRKIGENLRRAAAELKSSDREASARLSNSAAKVQSADISTIHACLYKILRRYFSELGLPQDSRLVSNTAIIERMKTEAMRDTVNDLFEKGSDDFILLADILATVRETDRIDAELYKLAADLSSAGLDASALGKYADMLEERVTDGDSILTTPFGEPIADSVRSMIGHYTDVFRYYAEEFGLFTEVGAKYASDCAWLNDWLDRAAKALDDGNLSGLKALLAEYKPPRLTPIGKARCDLSDEYKEQRERFIKDAKAAADRLGAFTPDEIMLSKEKTVLVLRCMEKAVGAYYEAYAKKKRDASMLDFSDIEYFARKLLVDEDGNAAPAAEEIGGKYKYVFIDEYQDTNDAQDAIFRALSTNARRFMVGDIKQAIYRFRGADPSVFASYREKWAEADPENDHGFAFEPDGGRVLFMSDNFRSAEPVTLLTNAVSDYIMPHGEIPYSDGDRLICSRRDGLDQSWPDAEVCLIEKANGDGDGKNEEENENTEESPEVGYVARRIASMIGTYVGGKLIEPGDIAVLARSNTHLMEYRDALVKRGIPAVYDREVPLSASPAVLLLMCVLNFADNPLRDVYTAGALRSPVFGFSMDDIIKIRGYAGKLPLYIGVLGCAADEDGDTDLREKCASAVEWIEREKTISRGMSPSKYLEYLTDSIGVYSIDGIRENGMERDAINRFCSLAADFETSSASAVGGDDLSQFLDYAAEALGERGGDEKTASTPTNAVTVMTMHKSKGLQFPVCFVVECGAEFTMMRESRKTVVFNKELGVGMYLPDESGFANCDTFFRSAVSESIMHESLNEEMRVLYVALSRAENKLIVTGKPDMKIGNLIKLAQNEARFDDGYFVRKSRSYISWIVGALLKNRVLRVKMRVISGAGDECIVGENAEIAERPDTAETSGAQLPDFGERCAFVYPMRYLSAIPAKLTVSKLTPTVLDEENGAPFDFSRALYGADETEAEEKEPTLRRPSFMTGEKYATSAEKGTATHVFMQFADFGRLMKNGARAELDRLVAERFIPREQAELVSIKQIERFRESSLMDKLFRSPFVKREFRFNVRMDAADFTADEELKKELAEYGAKVTVQGVVDCVYRDPDTGELVLIDYKTDAMSDEERRDVRLADEKMRVRHTNQLAYYGKICSEMFGEQVKHRYIYSTVLGRMIEV